MKSSSLPHNHATCISAGSPRLHVPVQPCDIGLYEYRPAHSSIVTGYIGSSLHQRAIPLSCSGPRALRSVAGDRMTNRLSSLHLRSRQMRQVWCGLLAVGKIVVIRMYHRHETARVSTYIGVMFSFEHSDITEEVSSLLWIAWYISLSELWAWR